MAITNHERVGKAMELIVPLYCFGREARIFREVWFSVDIRPHDGNEKRFDSLPRRQAKWRSSQVCTTTAARPPSARHRGAICIQACLNIRPLEQGRAAHDGSAPARPVCRRWPSQLRKPRLGAVALVPAACAACEELKTFAASRDLTAWSLCDRVAQRRAPRQRRAHPVILAPRPHVVP